MTDLVHARVLDHLARLRLRHVAERIDAMLSTYLDFLDGLLSEEVASKQRKLHRHARADCTFQS